MPYNILTLYDGSIDGIIFAIRARCLTRSAYGGTIGIVFLCNARIDLI